MRVWSRVPTPQINRFSYLRRNLRNVIDSILGDRLMMISFSFLAILLLLALLGPIITPYEYDETLYTENGEIIRNAPPSLEHPFGTTNMGYDVFSRIIFGARPTMMTGLLGGGLIISIGMTIGVTAGYVGGTVDNILMRFTDLMYSVPLIPFAIVLIAFFGADFLTSIVIIGAILWRGSARVLRAQVLQIKERPFIMAARATGANTPRIIFKHILPNVLPMAVLFFSLGIAYSILTQAGLSFIGVSDPFIPSWGVMVRNAYFSGMMAQSWWWSIPPGLLISFTVLAAFLLGRGYETTSQELYDKEVD